MKISFIVTALLLSLNYGYGQSNYLKINACEIQKTTRVIDLIIKNHLKIMKRRGLYNPKNKLLIISIMPDVLVTKYLDSLKTDSIYPDSFLLKTSNNTDAPYNVLVETYHNSDIELKRIFRDSKNILYINKYNWNIFIVSNTFKLIPIDTANTKKEFVFCDKRKSKKIIWYTNRSTSYSINMMFNSAYEIRYIKLSNRKIKYFSRIKKQTYIE